MPAKAESRKVLDGRAEVLSYKRDPGTFYLRTYDRTKDGYTSLKIEGVSDLETACRSALDIYLDLKDKPSVTGGSGPNGSVVKVKTKRRVRLDDQVKIYLAFQEERLNNQLIKDHTYRQNSQSLHNWFLPYCEHKGLVYTKDIKMGCLDDFPVFCNKARNTIRAHLINIKTFLKHLARNKLMEPAEAALIPEIAPKVKIREVDLSANPPFRDEKEWMTFVKHLHQWVKEGEEMNNVKNLYYRRKFWSLIMLLKQTGARPVEALNIRWSDIQIEDVGRISKSQRQLDEQALREQGVDPSELPEEVQRQLGRVPRHISHIRILDTKTGAPREVTCNSAEVLARWRRFQKERLAYVQKKHPTWNIQWSDDNKVFDSPINAEWRGNNYSVLTKSWRSIMERAEPELRGPLLSSHSYNIYSLRATRAQELLTLGVDVAIAAKSLGHSANMMLKVYSRLPVREQAMKAAISGIEFGKRKSDVRTVELEEVEQ